jgi:carbon-monoxide dehydrogenase large subunit
MKFFGDRLLRLEDPRLLTGRGRFVGDIALPGLLRVAMVRSPHAHARLARIDAERARAHPGVADVVTFADLGPAGIPLPCVPVEPALRERNFTLLARDRVRYVGELVAAVVADSRYTAEDARDLVEVEYDPLPVVQELVPAAGGPAVHDDVPDNVAGRLAFRVGDVEAALARAPHVARERFVAARGGGQPMETRGIMADYRAGLLTVWASSQVPHQIRQFISHILGLAPHEVRVLAPDVGGGFGAKLIVYPEDVLVPFLAVRLGQPVQWLEDRLEHMAAATQERVQVHEVTVGFDDEGRILAFRDHFAHDNGAYTPRGLIVPRLTASMLSGPYRIPALEVQLTSLFTNRVPVTPYRGAGQPQSVFVIERVLDLVARLTRRDRAEVRLCNLVPPTAMPYDVGLPHYRAAHNVIYDSGDFPGGLRRALELAGYEALVQRCAAARAEGRLRGVGMACYVEMTGAGPYEGATARIDPAGRISVFTGITSQGQGHETSFAQISASELGVTPPEVAVVGGDTLALAHGIGTFASRGAVVGGAAIALACRELRARALALAARLLGVAADEVEQRGAAFATADGARRVTFAELAVAAAVPAPGCDPGLEVTRFYQPEGGPYASGAHVVEVEVDPATAAVRIAGYWVSHDCGRVINPLVVEGQILGGIAMGIGNALLEEIIHDEHGQPLTRSYMDYLLPSAGEVPRIAMDHVETPSPVNPLGVKGVGESGTLPVAAAVAAAVEDALSLLQSVVREVPLSPRRLHALLRAAPAG